MERLTNKINISNYSKDFYLIIEPGHYDYDFKKNQSVSIIIEGDLNFDDVYQVFDENSICVTINKIGASYKVIIIADKVIIDTLEF